MRLKLEHLSAAPYGAGRLDDCGNLTSGFPAQAGQRGPILPCLHTAPPPKTCLDTPKVKTARAVYQWKNVVLIVPSSILALWLIASRVAANGPEGGGPGMGGGAACRFPVARQPLPWAKLTWILAAGLIGLDYTDHHRG